jgi:hypothetical protein
MIRSANKHIVSLKEKNSLIKILNKFRKSDKYK